MMKALKITLVATILVMGVSLSVQADHEKPKWWHGYWDSAEDKEPLWQKVRWKGAMHGSKIILTDANKEAYSKYIMQVQKERQAFSKQAGIAYKKDLIKKEESEKKAKAAKKAKEVAQQKAFDEELAELVKELDDASYE
jgi:hypothetical protein